MSFVAFSRVFTIVIVRWPTTVTSKPNAHSKLKIAHIKFKSLTANSNRLQQITNRSHQIQIAHSKFKSLTANSNRSQRITNHSQQITNHCTNQRIVPSWVFLFVFLMPIAFWKLFLQTMCHLSDF